MDTHETFFQRLSEILIVQGYEPQIKYMTRAGIQMRCIYRVENQREYILACVDNQGNIYSASGKSPQGNIHTLYNGLEFIDIFSLRVLTSPQRKAEKLKSFQSWLDVTPVTIQNYENKNLVRSRIPIESGQVEVTLIDGSRYRSPQF